MCMYTWRNFALTEEEKSFFFSKENGDQEDYSRVELTLALAHVNIRTTALESTLHT